MDIIKLLTLSLLLVWTACNSSHIQENTTDTLTEIKSITSVSQNIYERTPQQIEEEKLQDISDSINMIKALELALEISNKNKHKKSFMLETDSLIIQYGYIASSSIKHLKIIRHFIYGIKVNIYRLQEGQFKEVLFKEIASMGYVGDTLRDVNGDGRIDYLIHTYPPAGCCLRDVFHVYLQKHKGTFAEEVFFINPTFYPSEKMIRGICYGHFPPYYKYKWNGGKVDTIEYIFLPDSTNGQHYVKKKTCDENEKGTLLEELPKEYENIEYL